MRRQVLLAWFAAVILLVGMTMTTGAAAQPHGAAAVEPAATSSSPGFVSVTPVRVLDTRTGREPAAGSVTDVTVAGRGGVPATGVAAVVVNVTAVLPAGIGYVTAYPTGVTRPTASTLNYVQGRTVANQAVVKLGAGGRISLFTLAKANLLVDVTGYYPAGAAFDPLTPARDLDTRTGREPGAGSVTRLVVTGHGGVPATGVAAVVLNVTAVLPAGVGYVSVWPAGVTRPTASTVNYVAGRTVAGMTIAKVGAGGAVDLYTLAEANLVVDVTGWIPTSSDYTPITPARLLDTRVGLGAPKGPVPARGAATVQVTGRAGVPADATAVEVNVTAVKPAGVGYVTAYPAGVARPTASTLNYVAGQTVANSATLKLGTGGRVTLYTLATTNLVLDITGYWTPPAPASPMTWGTPTMIDHPQGPPASVSCPTTSFCAAVDNVGKALTFNGTTWSVPRSIDPNSTLSSVSCPTGRFCAAVDRNGNALTYNGSTWSAPRSIDPNVASGLTAVSCPTATFCATVDWAGNALTFNGTTWSAPVRVDDGGLSSVSCPTATFCAAVDGDGDVVTFNGTAWSAPASIDPNGYGLTSVSCPTSRFCAAVDGDGNALTFNGTTWSAPKSIDPMYPFILSVSCTSSTFCIAISSSGAIGPVTDSVMRFDGSTWTQAGDILDDNAPDSVSCTSSTSCVAVDVNGHETRYNGSSWTEPTTIDYGAFLSSVSCPTATFCAAVDGGTGNVLTFDGAGWTDPTPIDYGAFLPSVSCPTATFCAAVGDNGSAVMFDGSTWSAPRSIDPGSASAWGLSSVSCPSSGFCAAVGSDGSALMFDGSTWSVPQSIDPGGVLTGEGLSSVSCSSSSFCAAVDQAGNVLMFDGSTWSLPQSIDPESVLTGEGLSSVSCPSSSFCATVDGAGNALIGRA